MLSSFAYKIFHLDSQKQHKTEKNKKYKKLDDQLE